MATRPHARPPSGRSEETGYKVRAMTKPASNVFKCEVVAANLCTQAVDEGFLEKAWFSHSQLKSVQYCGGTWGDKRGLLFQSISPEPSGGVDECGCVRDQEGWSSTTNQCSPSSQTSPAEAAQCLASRGEVDECGCRRGQEGWSSTGNMSHPSTQTDASDAAQCVTPRLTQEEMLPGTRD